MKQLTGISEEQFHKARTEADWSPAQVVAHVCESPLFALVKVLRVATGDSATIGRTPEDWQIRLQAITDHAKDTLAVALDRLVQADT
ncbi:MAG: hypothetical protein ABIH46_14280, partial [Chloroflexota bacterium]